MLLCLCLVLHVEEFCLSVMLLLSCFWKILLSFPDRFRIEMQWCLISLFIPVGVLFLRGLDEGPVWVSTYFESCPEMFLFLLFSWFLVGVSRALCLFSSSGWCESNRNAYCTVSPDVFFRTVVVCWESFLTLGSSTYLNQRLGSWMRRLCSTSSMLSNYWQLWVILVNRWQKHVSACRTYIHQKSK